LGSARIHCIAYFSSVEVPHVAAGL